jgi:hypothetical protein
MPVRKLSVLLIEDDAADARWAQRLLDQATTPMTVTWVDSLAAALGEMNSKQFDVVVTDLSLPDSRGLETVVRIRAQCEQVPIVVLTGNDDRSAAVALLEAGAQDYIVKGCHSHDGLDRAIQYSIQRQQSTSLLAQKNRKLEKLYKQANQFVDNVSHEFRTPLTVIKEYVSIIRDGLTGEVTEEQQRMLTVVEDRADDLNVMVDDMLDVSKLEAGMLGAWRKNCQVATILQHTWPPLERKANIKNVELQWDIPEDLPEVYCDEDKVGRIVCNLAMNALKFCGTPGKVQISASHDPAEQEVKISVSDNGAGIDDDSQQAIFTRFTQLTSSIQSSTKGFGLGLSIAKELAELNFGSLSVASKLGEGSTFSFTIPVSEPPEILRRYLARLKRIDEYEDSDLFVSLVTASIDATCDDAIARGVDAFFNCHLRKNDLLFRVAPTTWLLVLPEPESQLEHYFDRIQKGLADFNRNRPAGSLPVCEFSTIGSWRAAADEQIICSTERTLHAAEVCFA